ncbi:methyltransferase domain-containing protein [Fodinicola feengrottensis]|uniref:hypothetical protein n=1 Tax=Fodinicola feengrottensis TaxID=435914 RepID=UPI002442CA7D|nr:hypothetical protein [Fodinicola feengrottensis]
MLRPGGTITVIEGDHGSAFFHPASAYAQATIDCLVELQARAGGDGLLGRQVEPLLTAAGFRDVVVRPRTMYVDRTRPALVEGFTRNTFLSRWSRAYAMMRWLPVCSPAASGIEASRTFAGSSMGRSITRFSKV